MNRNEAAKVNCKSFAEARNLKAKQLEQEIQESSASSAEKVNMMHSMSKLLMFSSDERDHLVRVGTEHNYYQRWLDE